jgi:hypothetical protein
MSGLRLLCEGKRTSRQRVPVSHPPARLSIGSLRELPIGPAPDGQPPGSLLSPRNHRAPTGLIQQRSTPMADPTPETEAETGKQIPSRRHDAGSGANETTDGLDATTEALRHATEDTPSGAKPEEVETVPVFDRADLPPKI